jgi:Tfp pilus assembly protein PilO
MNFKKLPKEKRDHLILVVLVTAAILGGLGFGLIRAQYESLKRIRTTERKAAADLQTMKNTINRAEQIEIELGEVSRALASLEEGMASGDPYSWAIDMVRRFRVAHRVDVPVISQPVVSENTLLPDFPYKQASFALSGTGFYHDIGRFIADFENQFPEIRIVNLRLNPVASLVNEEKEKLEFKMDIVALMRPNPS